MADTAQIGVQFDVLLEATVEDVFSDIIDDHVAALLVIVPFRFQLLLGAFEPTVHVRNPANIGAVDVEHTGTTSSSGRGVSQVGNLENETHASGQENTIVRHQGQDFVVVHDRVQGLNPFRVDITIQDTPLVHLVVLVFFFAFGLGLHDHGQDTVLPFLSLAVAAVEFVGGDSLWVQGVVFGSLPVVVLQTDEGLPDG